MQLLPRAVQDLVRRVLAEFRERSRRGQRRHDHDDRVGGRSDADRLLGEHAGAQRLKRCERGTLGLCLEGRGDPAADAAQTQVVPHLDDCAGQLLAGVHGDDLVGQAGVAPCLVVTVMVVGRAACDRDVHVAQVGGHLGEAAARVLGDGPGGQGFLSRIEIGAHDPRGRDPDAEKALNEFGSLRPLVVVAHDPART